MEPGPSGQEDRHYGLGRRDAQPAAMEPGPSGQEDTRPCAAQSTTPKEPQWSLALQARKTGSFHRAPAGVFTLPQWSLALQARKTPLGRRAIGVELEAAMEPGPSGQEDRPMPSGAARVGQAAMEPGPSGQEDWTPPPCLSLFIRTPQWSLALQARKTLNIASNRPYTGQRRNGAWPFRPGRPGASTSPRAGDASAAMEPGPSGQEDDNRRREGHAAGHGRNGAWPFRPGRPLGDYPGVDYGLCVATRGLEDFSARRWAAEGRGWPKARPDKDASTARWSIPASDLSTRQSDPPD